MSKKKWLAGAFACVAMFLVLLKTTPGQLVPREDFINKYNALYGMASFVFGLVTVLFLGQRKLVFELCKDILQNRRLIINLSKNDFKTKYVASNLGAVWNFVQPVVTVSIYVFVFQYGFKAVPVSNVPYVLWLVAGIIPWFFFSDAVMSGTNALIEYTYLVKKMVFKIDILPMVKVLSNVFVHGFFILIGVCMYITNAVLLDIHIIQVLYYSLCTLVLAIGISYLTSAVVVFFRDLGQIVNIALQFGMWLTPIMWHTDILTSTALRKIMKLNPMYYITDGYRDAFYNKMWFWDKAGQTMYFWVLVAVIFIIGAVVYKKLEKHFADVL